MERWWKSGGDLKIFRWLRFLEDLYIIHVRLGVIGKKRI